MGSALAPPEAAREDAAATEAKQCIDTILDTVVAAAEPFPEPRARAAAPG